MLISNHQKTSKGKIQGMKFRMNRYRKIPVFLNLKFLNFEKSLN